MVRRRKGLLHDTSPVPRFSYARGVSSLSQRRQIGPGAQAAAFQEIRELHRMLSAAASAPESTSWWSSRDDRASLMPDGFEVPFARQSFAEVLSI